MRNIKYILAQCSQGQKKLGVEKAGDYLLGMKRKNYPRTVIRNNLFNSKKGYEKLAKTVEQSHRNNMFPLTLGGDHSISLGSVTGSLNYYGKDLTVIWVDAHADINTKRSSPSGNLHGMSLSHLTGMELPFFESSIDNSMSHKNLIYLGLRDLDKFEKNAINYYGIQNKSSKQLMRNTFDELNNLKIPTDYVHLSIDVDVLDPSIIKSTGTPVSGGIDMKCLKSIIENIGKNKKIVSADLVELNLEIGGKKSQEISFKNTQNILNTVEKVLNDTRM